MVYKCEKQRRRCNALSRRKRVARQRSEILEILGNCCVSCGFDDARALAIDHIKAGGAKERATIGGGYYSYLLKKLKLGATEYQILCFNCNQIKKVENDEERFRVH